MVRITGTGKRKYVPKDFLEFLENIKKELGVKKDSEGFRIIKHYAIKNRERKRRNVF